MIKICLCDDNPEFTKLLMREVNSITENFNVSIMSYNNSSKLKNDLNDKLFDIYILDICMPDIDGMELAKHINTISKNHLIIFFTSKCEYVFNSFKLNIFRYIKKESYKEELKESLISAINKIENDNKKYTFKTKNGVITVSANDIIYFTMNNRNIEIYYNDKSDILVGMTISNLKEYLSSYIFFNIDRSTVINMNNYSTFNIGDNMIIMNNSDKLYISRYRKKDLIKLIKVMDKIVWLCVYKHYYFL